MAIIQNKKRKQKKKKEIKQGKENNNEDDKYGSEVLKGTPPTIKEGENSARIAVKPC